MGDLLVRCKGSKVARKEETQGKDNGSKLMKVVPVQIWELIIGKLTPFSRDYFRFGGVCKQWFSILMEDRHRKRSRAQQQQQQHQLIPLLLVSTPTPMVSRLYSVTDTKFMEGINLLVPYNYYDGNDLINNYCGSSYSWLSFVLKSYEIILYNPFISQSIRLPALMRDFDKRPSPHDFPNYYFWLDTYFHLGYLGYQYRVRKVVLSAGPRTDSDFLVVAIYGALRRLAFFRPNLTTTSTKKSFSFPSWTYLLEDDVDCTAFDDVVFHQGLLYAINSSYHVLLVIQVDGSGSSNGDLVIKTRIRMDAPTIGGFFNDLWYLVETSTKELLLLARLLHLKLDAHHSTKRFEVFKLNKLHGREELLQWVKVESLDGDSVFVGGSPSISVVASDSTGCPPNSIYFTDDFPFDPRKRRPYGSFGPHDMGSFCLEDGRMSKLCNQADAHKHFPPPIWILPMF